MSSYIIYNFKNVPKLDRPNKLTLEFVFEPPPTPPTPPLDNDRKEDKPGSIGITSTIISIVIAVAIVRIRIVIVVIIVGNETVSNESRFKNAQF